MTDDQTAQILAAWGRFLEELYPANPAAHRRSIA